MIPRSTFRVNLAEAAIKSLPEMAAIKQQAAETWKQLVAPVDTRYQWEWSHHARPCGDTYDEI